LRDRLGRTGCVNVRFETLDALARSLAAPALAAAGRAPLDDAWQTEALRLALGRAGWPLRPDPSRRASTRATIRLLTESGTGADAALRGVASTWRRLTAQRADPEEVLALAARSARESPRLRAALGTVIWYLPGSPSRAAEELVLALASGGPAAAVLGL